MFIYELLCDSGFGDRILDLWTIVVIARLLDANRELVIKWKAGIQFPGFNSNYNTRLFSIDGCKIIDGNESNQIYKFIDIEDIIGKGQSAWGRHMFTIMSRGIIGNQLFPINTFWGTTGVERVMEALPFYGLPIYDVRNVYYSVVSNTRPCVKIEVYLQNANFNAIKPIGLHIRLTDKCVDNPNSFTMSRNDYSEILRKCKEFVATNRGTYFVSSEDKQACRDMQEYIRETGSKVFEFNYDGLREDEIAMLDFFALSRCSAILQCTKYSTFSIAASIIHRIPLINFYGYENSALLVWRNTANIVIM